MDAGSSLLKEVSLCIGSELMHKQRSCKKCHGIFEVYDTDELLRKKRIACGANGNVHLCWRCDENLINGRPCQRM